MATAQEGLAKIAQQDFAAGAFQGTARHLIPSTGLYATENGLYDDDGSIYKRGGSQWETTAFGTSMRWTWDGILAGGPRTVVANEVDFGVEVAGAISNLGGAGLTAPMRATVLGGMLFIDDGTIYGGSLAAADYSTGTIALTTGSTAVVGTGTDWDPNVDAGMLIRRGSERYYAVASRGSDTALTLTEPYQGVTGTGIAYTATRLGSTANAPYIQGTGYATIFNRLLVMAGTHLLFSGGRQANGDVLHSFDPNDDHEFSGTLLGVQPIRDLVFVFTTDGVFAISGMAMDLLDPDGVNFQQQVEPVNSDLILWGKEGIATYQNQMLVPGTNGLWAMGAASAPALLTRSVQRRWRDHVRAGHKPGLAAVYRNHYMLPVLDASNTPVDMLVCRLDRPQSIRGFGDVFPWSWWTGQAASLTAVATRISGSASRSPELIGASYSSGRLTKLGGVFEPSDARAADADTTDFMWAVELRDYATGDGNENHVRRLEVWYELVAVTGAVTAATIRAYVSVGLGEEGLANWDEVDYDEFDWVSDIDAEYVPLSGGAPEDFGRHPYTWHFNKRGRFVRARLESDDPVRRLVLRGVKWFVRPSAKDR